MTHRRAASTVFLAYEAAFGGFTRMMWTTYIVFAVVELDLDPLQLVLLGTVLETTYLLLEIPTGVVADTVSRRLSVQIGVIGCGVAFLVLGLAPGFALAVVSNVLYGVFATFTSGADVAWLTDEVGEAEARSLYVRGEQAWHAAALAGIVVGVGLAAIDLRLPVIVGAVGIIVLGIWMFVAMPEERFVKREREPGSGSVRQLVTTFTGGVREVRGHHVLGLILVVSVFYGMASEGFDRLGDLHVLTGVGLDPEGGMPTLIVFGAMEAVSLLLGLGLITYVKHRVRLEGHVRVARLLRVIDVALFTGVIVFAVSGNVVVAVVASWVIGGLRSVREPIFTAWVNQGLDPATRATVNSMATQTHAVGEASAGPVIGLIGERSVPLALAVSGLLRLPALLLYRRAICRGTVGTAEPSDETIELEEGPEAPGDVDEP